MPPKKKGGDGPSKKTIEKEKKRIIEDKTFGLKNKKGAKQQKYVQQVQKQVTYGNKSFRDMEKIQQEKEARKAEKKGGPDELTLLFKPVAELQKISKGADPKSILCIFFKQGTCIKGDKCRFSHDLTIERKAEKKNIYEDERNEMDDWNQEQLEDVISKKHGAQNKGLPPTTIICKYFLDAVEAGKYGWFWNCPNGDGCHYRHCLPPGFVLRKDRKKMEEQKETISLDELIETERRALGMNQTKVTLQTFLAWKKRKRAEKIAAGKQAKEKKQADFAQGRMFGISGREMFEFNPEFANEGEEIDGDICDSRLREPEDGEEEYEVHDIDVSAFDVGFLEDPETGDAASPNDENVAANTANAPPKDQIVIDEALFNDADLEGLEEELEDLGVES
ncbi:Zinc finger CCCH domain-containing protein 15 [Echinococcus granulosus]|uniref:Zinc finger CCCH domain-containing protein n=2 Tax=Echinococcus granulosus TaxID=6210 RepID=W6UCH9_ECHGR|nr:Zinc finger CCCH domain-containing protein [Echinococcus granulosus]EUB55967.1 Zinc finger CCCH domain-containing protein [Echinococcus granulosus]KAH9282868.1 Zinc finger CCCH domain-containing protein 15 [Echinococcus granulosus]